MVLREDEPERLTAVMMSGLGLQDALRILDVVREINGAGGDFHRAMLASVTALVSSETVSYNVHHTGGNPREEQYVIEPAYAEHRAGDDAYHEHLGQHPVFDGITSGRLGAGASIALSDLMNSRVWHRLPLYTEYYRQREVEDQLVVVLGAGARRCALLVFGRSRRGFTARERDAVALLTPHLRQSVRQRRRLAELSRVAALRTEEVPDPAWQQLTGRELDVVRCLSEGIGDQAIGRTLGISRRTVGKHLENIYRKVGVPGRAALLARAARTPSAPTTPDGRPDPA
jgi:DNA-binding CsgD family transcriptional regulator